MITVVKIGGNVLDDTNSLENFIKNFVEIPFPKVLVHGGGKLATVLAEKLGIEQQVVEGRRITDERTLEVVTMVYAGLINKNLVAKLNAAGCMSVGLCGADGNLILAQKRKQGQIDFGFVGDIVLVDTTIIDGLLAKNYCPVIASITHDAKGQLLNTNADTIASSIAVALSKNNKVKLIYCFEKKGVLSDLNDENSVIVKLTHDQIVKLKNEGKIHTGMIPKLDNAINALNNGVEEVCIGHAEELITLFNGRSGTKITIS